jgi:hydrogenase maturation protein HypF
VTPRGRRIEIRGTVQGVGFRPWVYRVAAEHGIAGRVRNDAAGVVIDAFGAPAALDAFARVLQGAPPPAAAIREVRARAIPAEHTNGFSIDPSAGTVDREVSIPADLATCRDCLADIFHPANRRFEYAFTTCTNCGPRFTISTDVPYDRRVTTMADFTMCAACRDEYDNPEDRRFHAQANACPACGPLLTVLDPTGRRLAAPAPLASAIEVLAAGGIVAIKGIGGFHLACDATSREAVERLRRRKRRDEKPFAVMARDLREAATLALMSDTEQATLASMTSPILLVPARPQTVVASNVSPDSPLVGLLLPYTPLHHLIMRRVGRPLVMTSGNHSDEPLAYRTGDAVCRLATIADLLLTHDRAIAAPCDDSVVRVVAGAPAVLRRARGYVPKPCPVSPPFDVPVLACGAQLKNTFCIGVGGMAYLSTHFGDLDNLDTFDAFAAEVARMERLVGIEPAIVAHDLHPDFASTRYARLRPGAITVAVQHHHAHIASAMAEHGLTGPVIGVAYDGAGHGPDGTSWGGEVMLATHERFERVSTLRPVPLVGGEMAVRQPWRLAVALIEDACGGQPPLDHLPLFSKIPARDLERVQQLLASFVPLPRAHGAGRYFDAIGALVLGRTDARYEGQIALALNGIADPAERGCYGYAVDRRPSPWELDLRPMVREVLGDLRAAVAAPVIAARFHNTLVAATAAAVRALIRERGSLPVVLTGGCFQNPWLAERLAGMLAAEAAVYLHRQVPSGDGGIALGQAVAAAAIVRSRESISCA